MKMFQNKVKRSHQAHTAHIAVSLCTQREQIEGNNGTQMSPPAGQRWRNSARAVVISQTLSVRQLESMAFDRCV